MKIVFTMKDVTDGGLAFRIDEPTMKVDWKENSTRFNIRERVDRNIEVARRNMRNLISQLRNVLEGEDKFVFPVTAPSPFIFLSDRKRKTY